MLQTTPHPLVAPLQREDSLSQDKAALDYDPLRELCEPDLLQEGRSGSSDDFCPSSGSPPGQQCHENEETLYGQQHPGMVRGMPPSLSPGQQHPGMVRGMPPSFGPGSPLHDDELPDMDEPHPADLMGSIGRSESTKKDAPMWTVQEDLLILDLVEQHGRKWCKIASHLPGRTGNAVRNRWNRMENAQVGRVKRTSETGSERNEYRCRRCGQSKRGHICPALTEGGLPIDFDEIKRSRVLKRREGRTAGDSSAHSCAGPSSQPFSSSWGGPPPWQGNAPMPTVAAMPLPSPQQYNHYPPPQEATGFSAIPPEPSFLSAAPPNASSHFPDVASPFAAAPHAAASHFSSVAPDDGVRFAAPAHEPSQFSAAPSDAPCFSPSDKSSFDPVPQAAGKHGGMAGQQASDNFISLSEGSSQDTDDDLFEEMLMMIEPPPGGGAQAANDSNADCTTGGVLADALGGDNGEPSCRGLGGEPRSRLGVFNGEDAFENGSQAGNGEDAFENGSQAGSCEERTDLSSFLCDDGIESGAEGGGAEGGGAEGAGAEAGGAGAGDAETGGPASAEATSTSQQAQADRARRSESMSLAWRREFRAACFLLAPLSMMKQEPAQWPGDYNEALRRGRERKYGSTGSGSGNEADVTLGASGNGVSSSPADSNEAASSHMDRRGVEA